MKRLFRNKKGVTIVEMLISLAVIGIVAAPMLMIFTSAQMVIWKTESRLETNAVMRTIKENVTRAVKFGVGNKISSYDGSDYDLPNATANGHNGKNLMVIGHDGSVNGKYKFDAVRTMDFGSIEGAPNTCEYLITLKDAEGQVVQKLTLLINSLD